MFASRDGIRRMIVDVAKQFLDSRYITKYNVHIFLLSVIFLARIIISISVLARYIYPRRVP